MAWTIILLAYALYIHHASTVLLQPRITLIVALYIALTIIMCGVLYRRNRTAVMAAFAINANPPAHHPCGYFYLSPFLAGGSGFIPREVLVLRQNS